MLAALILVIGLLPLLSVSLEQPTADAKSPTSTDTTFPAGSYIIDMGAFVTTKPTGLQPYGILYKLLTVSHTPVAWIIKDGKTGGIAPPGTGLPALASQTSDFSASVVPDGAGTTNTTPVQTKSYLLGAFVIPKGFITPQVDSIIAAFPNVVVDKAAAAFSAPVYKTLEYWPKAVLDAQNGAIAQGFYTNAGIPNEVPAYSWKSPSQLNSCDDIYIMPHADPTWATHSYLKPFNAQGGYIWAGCHAVSVLENLVNPNNAADGMNFLTTNGLVPFGSHGGGTPPYNYNTDGSDPVMQIGAPLDAATQNGSEQIYMPKIGSAWRPSSIDVTWDATQADVQAAKSPGDARVLTYGRGFGSPTNGLVMYEAGHSINKGTIGDVPAQRAFFNFLLLGGIDRAPSASVSIGSQQLLSGTSTTLSAQITGGSPGYNYQWTSSCGGTFSPASGFSGTGAVSTTFTAPAVTAEQSCAIQVLITDQCGRTPFGATSVQVVPSADLQITKNVDKATVSVNGTLTYTLTVKNNGAGIATAPTVTDVLPTGTQYLSATPTPGTVSGQTLAWTLPDLAVNGTSTITVTARALTAGALLTNTASVTSTTADPNLANNTATAISRVLNSGISIEKIARPLIVGPGGGSVTFEFVVHNTGTDPLTNVVVTDNPACTTISGPTGDLNHDGVLAPKFNGVETEIWRYTCTRTVTTATADVAQSSSGVTSGIPPLDSSTYTKQDVVQVTAKDPLDNTLTSVASTVVTISNPSIAVTKVLSPAGQSPAPGQKATFTVTVTNTGNVPLVGVNTTDIWTGTCNQTTLPTLAVNASYSMTCDATVPTTGSASDGFGSGTPSYATGTGWAGSWVESGGETNGAAAGNIQVVDGTAVRIPSAGAGWPLPTGYSTPNVLWFTGNKAQLTRTVDLAGKTSAILRLSYFRTAAFNNGGRDLSVSVSPDNGTTWTTQNILPNTANADDTGWSTFEMTVSGTFTSNTLVRFNQANLDLSNRDIYLDDVRLVSNQVNTVTATARDEYGNPVTATASASVQPGFPSLTITKSTTSSWLKLGDAFSYTVTVTNTGSTFQSNINVTDSLPAGLTQNGSVTVSRPSYWTTLASDGFGTGQAYNTGTGWATDWTETNETTSPTAGKIQVSTTVGSPASSLWFNSPGSNASTAYITRNVNLGGQTAAQLQFQCLRTSPDSTDDILGIYVNNLLVYEVNRNTATSVCPTSGSTFGSTITVPLPSGALVSNAPVTIKATGNKQYWVDNVTVLVPGSTSSVTAGNPPNLTAAGGNNGSATNFGLAPGASMTFTIPVTVAAAPSDGLQFSNVARTTSDQQTSPVSASVTTPYLAPNYTITKVAIETWVNNLDTATRNVTYRIELTNTGNVALNNVSVSDPSCNAPPAYVFGDLNNDNRLQIGEIWRYQCTRTVTAPISSATPPAPVVVPNTATATMTDTISGTAVGTKTASAEVRVVHPAITITPSPTTAVIQPGGTVAYTYTVTNSGDIGLTGVTPTAANCSPLSYQSGDVNGDGILNTTETWSYSCTTSAISANQLNQTVSVSGADRIFGYTVTDTKQVNVYVTPPLAITKSAYDATSGHTGSSIVVGAGNSITYTYAVTSPSATPAVGLPLTNVQVTDDKCAPVTAVTSGGFVVGDTNTDNKLDPGETWTFTCTGGTLAATTTNHAYASGTYTAGGGGTVLSNQAQATVTVQSPQLTLGKESNSETVRTGHAVIYTFTVTNTGATSFQLGSLGAPSDKVVDSGGTITSTTACSPITGPSFPHDASHDVNGNGVLDPGDMLSYTCQTTLTVDTRDAFVLGTSTDTLGTLYTPPPALAQVFVIDPTFSVQKFATTSLGGPATTVPGIPGQPVTYTFTVTHTTPVTHDFHDGLESLSVTVTDPRCDQPPAYVSGDASNNGLLDPGEVWTYTCTLSSLPNGSPTVNTVTVTGSVEVRDVDLNGDPTNPADGLGDIVHTAQATVTPSTKQVTVRKQGLNCDVNQPVCANNFPGTSFKVYGSDPTVGSPTGTSLTNSPSGSATFVTGDLVVNNDYWLVETSAPAGFQLLAQPIRFHLTSTSLTLVSGTSSLITASSSTFTITITDVPATPLPKTGGRGFVPYLGLGLLLILAAGLTYVRPRRTTAGPRKGG